MRLKYHNNIDEIDRYFGDIKKYKPTSKDKEKELYEKIKKGDEKALNELITSNLKFVVAIAKTYRNAGIPFSELISEGNMGIIHAAHKFDGNKNIKFISYAVWWIKVYIQDYIQSFNKEKYSDIDDYTFDKVTNNEIDNEIINEMINEDYEHNINDIKYKRNAIEELMSCLKEREIKILSLYYGLYNNKEMTLDEIGQNMNLTQERVRQIKDKALIKLRSNALLSNDFDNLKSLI